LISVKKDWPDTNGPEASNSGKYYRHLRWERYCGGYCGTKNTKKSDRKNDARWSGGRLREADTFSLYNFLILDTITGKNVTTSKNMIGSLDTPG